MFTSPYSSVCSLLLLIAPAMPATAGVVDSSASGFTIRRSVVVASAPMDAYRSLAGSIGEWWNPEHTYSGDSRNMTIATDGDGCFCEKLDNGGIVRHMTVLYANPGATLRLGGGLGPLQEMAVNGTMTWNLTPVEGGTSIEMTYTAGGYYPKGLNTLAAVVDMVIGEQMTRLKHYIETGNPAPPATPSK